MIRCKVRAGFYLHFSLNQIHQPGTILDLSDEEFSRFAHQLELVKEPVESSNEKPKESKRAKVQG